MTSFHGPKALPIQTDWRYSDHALVYSMLLRRTDIEQAYLLTEDIQFRLLQRARVPGFT